LLAAPGIAAPPSASVIAVVGTGARARLEPVDARTLAPVTRGWSIRVQGAGAAALSPSGKQVAVVVGVDGERMLVVDAATGRIVRRYRGIGDTTGLGAEWGGLLWLSGEVRPSILGVGLTCGTGACVVELTPVGHGVSDQNFPEYSTNAVLKEGVALVYGDPTTGLEVYLDPRHDLSIDLPQMASTGQKVVSDTGVPQSGFGVVADVAHDRLFAISSAGLVAEVDHVAAKQPSISYHTVDLNGKPFHATWAGGGKIALWGEDGLGTIDTRTWTTQAVAPKVAGALATALGLAAWAADPADGLTVYRADGSKRLQVLIGTPIRTVQALGNFLYVDAGRYSVDLRTGKVFGPTKQRATVVTPTLAPIP
jgi:hypothetical protein